MTLDCLDSRRPVATADCFQDVHVIAQRTTALDVTVQAQVLRLMKEMKPDMRMAILYISHDLGVIARTAHEVAVMYLESIVEQAEVKWCSRTRFHRCLHG